MSNDRPSDDLRPDRDAEFETSPDGAVGNSEGECAPVLDEEFVFELDDMRGDWFLLDEGEELAGASSDASPALPEPPVLDPVPVDSGEAAGSEAVHEAPEDPFAGFGSVPGIPVPPMEMVESLEEPAEAPVEDAGTLAGSWLDEMDPEVEADSVAPSQAKEQFSQFSEDDPLGLLSSWTEDETGEAPAAANESSDGVEDLAGGEFEVPDAPKLQDLTDLEAFLQGSDESEGPGALGSPGASLPEDPLVDDLSDAFAESEGWTEKLSGLVPEDASFVPGPVHEEPSLPEEEPRLRIAIAPEGAAEPTEEDSLLAAELERSGPAAAAWWSHPAIRRFAAAAVVLGASYWAFLEFWPQDVSVDTLPPPQSRPPEVAEVVEPADEGVSPVAELSVVEDPVSVVPTPEPVPVPVEPDPVVEPTISDVSSSVVEVGPGPVAVEPTDPGTPAVTDPSTLLQPHVSRLQPPASGSEITALLSVAEKNALLHRGQVSIELENGHIFHGRVKRIRGTRLTIAQARSEFTFDLSRLSILDRDAPELQGTKGLREAVVVLKNGQRLRGHLIKDSAELVQLRFKNGTLALPRVDVDEVSYVGRIHF